MDLAARWQMSDSWKEMLLNLKYQYEFSTQVSSIIANIPHAFFKATVVHKSDICLIEI
jgi:hypothetical protein